MVALAVRTGGNRNGGSGNTVTRTNAAQVRPPMPWCEQAKNKRSCDEALRYFPFFDGLCVESNVAYMQLVRRYISVNDDVPVDMSLVWSEEMKVFALALTKSRLTQIQSHFRTVYRSK
jgi:hypothetical protein